MAAKAQQFKITSGIFLKGLLWELPVRHPDNSRECGSKLFVQDVFCMFVGNSVEFPHIFKLERPSLQSHGFVSASFPSRSWIPFAVCLKYYFLSSNCGRKNPSNNQPTKGTIKQTSNQPTKQTNKQTNKPQKSLIFRKEGIHHLKKNIPQMASPEVNGNGSKRCQEETLLHLFTGSSPG